jgi:hypothetical protein
MEHRRRCPKSSFRQARKTGSVLQDPAEAKARRLRLTTTGKFDIGELLYLSWREIQYLAPFQGNLDLSVFLPGVTGSGESKGGAATKVPRICHMHGLITNFCISCHFYTGNH